MLDRLRGALSMQFLACFNLLSGSAVIYLLVTIISAILEDLYDHKVVCFLSITKILSCFVSFAGKSMMLKSFRWHAVSHYT
jgi:hypothetical protein